MGSQAISVGNNDYEAVQTDLIGSPRTIDGDGNVSDGIAFSFQTTGSLILKRKNSESGVPRSRGDIYEFASADTAVDLDVF